MGLGGGAEWAYAGARDAEWGWVGASGATCVVWAWAGAGGAVCGVGAGVCGGVGVRSPRWDSAAEVIIDIIEPTDG